MTPLLLDEEPPVVAALRAEVERLRAQLAGPRDLDRLVSVKEAAHLAGATTGAIYMRVARGRLLRHPTPGTRRYRVRLSDVVGGGL